LSGLRKNSQGKSGNPSNPKTPINNQQSTINNQQSTIGNRQSAIGNRQSAIGNRQPVLRSFSEEGSAISPRRAEASTQARGNRSPEATSMSGSSRLPAAPVRSIPIRPSIITSLSPRLSPWITIMEGLAS
jgi:hypothetical protein